MQYLKTIIKKQSNASIKINLKTNYNQIYT